MGLLLEMLFRALVDGARRGVEKIFHRWHRARPRHWALSLLGVLLAGLALLGLLALAFVLLVKLGELR